MNSETSPRSPARLYASMLLFSLAVAMNCCGLPNGAVLAAALSYSLLRAWSLREPGDVRGNPLRFALPVFLVFQLVYWVRCLVLMYMSIPAEYVPMWWGYEVTWASPACANYLLIHYPYFLALGFGYRHISNPASSGMRRLQLGRTVVLGASFLAVAEAGFLLTFGQSSLLIDYVVSNVSRFRILFWILLTLLALQKRSRRITLAAIAIHAMCLCGGWLIVSVTKMRFFLLEELACIGLALITTRSRFRLRDCVWAGGLGLATTGTFLAATAVKTDGVPSDFSLQIAGLAVDQFVGRAASFHADAALLDSPRLQAFLAENRTAILLDSTTFPLSGVIWNQLLNLGGETNLDMRFTWDATGTFEESSTFLPGLTSLRFGLGIVTACIFAVGFGLLHGRAAGWLTGMRVESAWVMSQALFLPLAILGLHRLDFGGIPLTALLFALMFSLLAEEERDSVRPAVSEGGTEDFGDLGRVPTPRNHPAIRAN